MRDKPEDFLLISGDDPISLPMIALGAAGVISVVGNALPRQFSDMIRLCLKGDFKAAQKGHSALIEFTRMMFAEGSPAGVKMALNYLGVCGNVVRLPLVQVSSTLADKIVQETKLLASPVAVH
jgi:4-hydroxy-tetrahydrodipicolinate synthase